MRKIEPCQSPIPQYRFCGRDADGRIRVRDGSRKFLVEGTATKLLAGEAPKVNGWNIRAKSASGDADLGPAPVVFVAIGNTSGALYLIQGHVTGLLGDSARPARRTSTRGPMSVKNYQSEIKRIKACQELGGDPNVDMPFIARHSGRSIPTVYRDIKDGLLIRASKCGSASRWPFSEVDRYAGGSRPEAGA